MQEGAGVNDKIKISTTSLSYSSY